MRQWFIIGRSGIEVVKIMSAAIARLKPSRYKETYAPEKYRSARRLGMKK